jgi:hypothetical protein
MSDNPMNFGESWGHVVDLMADQKRALSVRINAASTVLSAIYNTSDDPTLKQACDGIVKLITDINDARYDAEVKSHDR